MVLRQKIDLEKEDPEFQEKIFLTNRAFINSVANLVSKIWSIVSVYIFVPIYIRILGEETYGLVAFFATLQTALNLLGIGLSSTLRREFATELENNYKYKLLRSVELIYVLIAIVICAICFFGSGIIANAWLNLSSLKGATVEKTLSLMGGSIALQLLINLYYGCLLGLEFQVRANMLQILWAMLKNVGGVILLIFKPDIILFYTWAVISDIFILFFFRKTVLDKIEYKKKYLWNLKDLVIVKTIWKYALGLIIISIVALLNKQFDKIVISRLLSLTDLGAYNLGCTLGQLTTMVSSAISIAMFANFTNNYSKGAGEELEKLFFNSNKVVALIVVCLGSFIMTFSNELLLFWTGSYEYAQIMETSGKFIVAGTALLGLQEIPYAFLLANGNTSINVKMGVSMIPLLVGGIYFATKKYGINGTGATYFFLMLLQTTIYLTVVYRTYFKGSLFRWLFHDMIAPCIFSVVLSILAKQVIYLLTDKLLYVCLLAVAGGFLAMITSFYIWKRDVFIISKNFIIEMGRKWKSY